MISLDLDSKAWEIINALAEFHPVWDRHMYEHLPEELAKRAEEHFKPMLAVRPNHTGDLERSIRYEVHRDGEGWEVHFYGLKYGIWIDVGNFPANDIIFSADYGHHVFPIDKRIGEPYFTPLIHGMGYRTSGVPTHYSEKTVEWLAQGVALEVAYDHVMRFLSEVIR